MRPDFVIIGAQKAGSTALARYLADHPQVYLPKGETRYFRDPWYLFESPTVLDEAVAPAGPGVRRRGIKCPDYLPQESCATRIRADLGLVDLIAVLREPVERAISAYFWGMQWGYVPVAPPEIGLPRLLDGSYLRTHPRAGEVLEYGLYAKHLARYVDLFGRDRLFVLVDDDLGTDRTGSLDKLWAFLDVDAVGAADTSARRVNEGVYSQTRLRLLQVRQRHILREFPGYPGRFLQEPVGLRSKVVDKAVAGLDRVVLRRVLDNSKPEIPAELRRRLADFYRHDVACLEQLLGRPLTRWTQQYV